jgi:hypothetical protein
MVTAPDHVAVNEYALLVTRHRYTLSLAAATHAVLQAHLTAAAMLPIAALMNMRLHITVEERAPRPYFTLAVCTPVDTAPPGAGPTVAAATAKRRRTGDDDSAMDVVVASSSAAAAASPENLKHLLQSPWYQNYLEKVRAAIATANMAAVNVVSYTC